MWHTIYINNCTIWKKYGFSLFCCVPVVQQSSYTRKISKVVSHILFHQSYVFAHTWHTLKPHFVFFLNYDIFPADLPFCYKFHLARATHTRPRYHNYVYGLIIQYHNHPLSKMELPRWRIWRSQVKTKKKHFLKIVKKWPSKVLAEPAFFCAPNERYVHRKYRKTSGSKKNDFWGKVIQKWSN